MAELGELVAAIVSHVADENDSCPFCPVPTQGPFTTHPGSANDSQVLESIMKDPGKLTTRQSNARPKSSQPQQQPTSSAKPKPNPIFSDATYGDYSAEAHHLISGNQAMKGHEIEHWIVAGSLVTADTGYSINNSDNGEWLPSIPEQYKEQGGWSSLMPAEKLRIASLPMKSKGQFHKGPHNITDKDDPSGLHVSYPKEVKRLLTDLCNVMHGWAEKCPLTKNSDPDKGPFTPNWRIHNMLDHLSRAIATDLKADRSEWRYFISTLAMKYHNENCPHPVV